MDTDEGSTEEGDRDQRPPADGKTRLDTALGFAKGGITIVEPFVFLTLPASSAGRNAALATLSLTRAALYLTESALKIWQDRMR
jgi:hypothetical protein